MTDEQQLLDIQQQLARAWLQRDRTAIESLLASEWSVTHTDGSVVSRADVIRSAFESNDLRIVSMTVDDVTVNVFGTTAVVRGRTVASALVNGTATDARLRFTDVFLKREGRWQAIASHASALVS